MPRYHILGGAKITKLTSALGPTGLVFTISDPAGWPTGGANGEFWVILNPEQANEEHLLVQSRSGSTLTVASTGKRGLDGTAAGDHQVDEVALHGFAGVQADDANAHQFDAGRDDHPQYLNSVRHAAITHTSGMLGADSVGATQIAPNAVGVSELADNSVDTSAIVNQAVTAAKIANDTITATQIATDAITSVELADNAVDTAALVDSCVTALKILDGTVGTAELANGSVTSAKAGMVISTYTPTNTNVILGTGGLTGGVYIKFGRLLIVWGYFVLGTGTADVTGEIIISLPEAAYDPSMSGFSYLGGAQAFQNSATRFAGTGLIKPEDDTTHIRAFGTAGSGSWDLNAPFDWNNVGSDRLNWFAAYVTAT